LTNGDARLALPSIRTIDAAHSSAAVTISERFADVIERYYRFLPGDRSSMKSDNL
jgi:hypothetical protein